MILPVSMFLAGFVLLQGCSAVPSLTSEAKYLKEHKRSPAFCAFSTAPVAFLRAFSGGASDHFYTFNGAEMQNAVQHLGYKSEGITGYIFTQQEPQTIPLYRLFSGSASDHFYTTDPSERDRAAGSLGYTYEGIAGYLYTAEVCGAEPLYRLYSPKGSDHFYTMSASERDNAARNIGYTFEGIVGYMLAAV